MKDEHGHTKPRDAYFCRNCGREAPAAIPRVPPLGWLMLSVVKSTAPLPNERYGRLGIYCTVACLMAARAALEDGERRRHTPKGNDNG